MSDPRDVITKNTTKSNLSFKILSYNQTANVLKVEINGRQYEYRGVSPYIFGKLDFRMRKAPGKVLNYLKDNFKFKRLE